MKVEKLDRLVAKARASGRFGEVLFAMESYDGKDSYRSGDGSRPFFIASATKLYTSTLLARLRERGVVDWDRPFVDYVPQLDVSNLHGSGPSDRTSRITVRHLLAQTSGLPDYFEGPRRDGATTVARLLDKDFAWNVGDVVRWSRDLQRPHFEPGRPGKAHYSDTNYQLLGAIIEQAYGVGFADVVQNEIARPLGLDHTWCIAPESVDRYDDVAVMRDGRSAPRIPLAMSSVGADGGIVSTLDDSIRFLRAFFSGALFGKGILDEMQAQWRKIFFPLEYGTGLMRFRVPWFFSPFKRFPDLVGHSGASGTVMFACPERELFVAGTVNQLRQRSAPYQLMMRALATVP